MLANKIDFFVFFHFGMIWWIGTVILHLIRSSCRFLHSYLIFQFLLSLWASEMAVEVWLFPTTTVSKAFPYSPWVLSIITGLSWAACAGLYYALFVHKNNFERAAERRLKHC
jgi:ABC-type antimicrobial peptide transport system permease subunit